MKINKEKIYWRKNMGIWRKNQGDVRKREDERDQIIL